MAVMTAGAQLTMHAVHSYATFKSPAVPVIPLTKQIIEQIMPYFPMTCKVIGGYLDDAQQFWKINYHWENLVSKIDRFQKLPDTSDAHKAAAYAIWKVMMTNPPLPDSGYLKDSKMELEDLSTRERIRERRTMMKQCKLDFRTLIIAAGLVDPKTEKTNPTPAEKEWWRAVAPVAMPGTSTHGTGYALDIKGNNVEITNICKALGASLCYNEASHMHVEWANGVKRPGL